MRFLSIVLVILLSHFSTAAQQTDEQQVRDLLAAQTSAWNRGDIEKFMVGYWKNDSLMFIGKSGITYGWQNTMDNYRKGYPDTTAMGQLRFDLIQFRPLSAEYMQVVGKWNLARTIGNLSGHFTLLLRKIEGNWQIIADHSS